jgi:hypothetical protein
MRTVEHTNLQACLFSRFLSHQKVLATHVWVATLGLGIPDSLNVDADESKDILV